ncbi:DUF2244 domain-containing protein [Oricola cellulosilytica]|uniref:DUF2244 domain-containing protein n=1 Tax=Oricola cellulosilytica TaxID=1429082 RepID=A0A4R0PE35_9HYPH|nr:DUF2244 domain-containing protein [Oricola cellulosilytica]TCD16055.1 DUF2244 domain-containing protein [Oricola cellulosilytica]
MSETTQTARGEERPVFSALLTPHRSLSRNGFVLLMILSCGVLFVQGFFFFITGAWPVATFLGLDLVALFLAFQLNYRAARAREEVRVSRTELLIRKVTPGGRATDHLYNPFWARFQVDRHREIGITGMQVTGEGRSTSVGHFLNPDDRESFATAFSHALATARR